MNVIRGGGRALAGHWPRCAGTGSRFTGDAGVATCPTCGRNNVGVVRGKLVAHKPAEGKPLRGIEAMGAAELARIRARKPVDTGRRDDRLSFTQAQALRDLRDHGNDDMVRPTTLASLRRRRLVRRDRALIGHILTDRGQLALRAHDERQQPKRPPCGHERIPVLRARTMATTLVATYLADMGGARNGHVIDRAERKLIANIANTIARVSR